MVPDREGAEVRIPHRMGRGPALGAARTVVNVGAGEGSYEPRDRSPQQSIRRPQRWDIRSIRRFMLWIGPLSSIYDFLAFFALLWVFKAGEATFHTGWFVQSLATQALVLFVIRTTGVPWKSGGSASARGVVPAPARRDTSW
jgi:magnesium-transporting ATPase (P-type)